jgi:hypothetical protein
LPLVFRPVMRQPRTAVAISAAEKIRARPSSGRNRQAFGGAPGRLHTDAIDWAGRYAKLAAGAQSFHDCMHLLGGPDDGIYGTSLDALGTADAFGFDDEGHPPGYEAAERRIDLAGGVARKGTERFQGFFSAGRAAVDSGFAGGNRFGVGAAIQVTATLALGLGQECVNTVYERGHFIL